jgi:hypothetical protein
LFDTEVSPSVYRTIEAELVGHELKSYWLQVLITERCSGRYVFQAVRERRIAWFQILGTYDDTEEDKEKKRYIFLFWTQHPYGRRLLIQDELFYLQVMRKNIDFARRKTYDWSAISHLEDRDQGGRRKRFLLTRILVPLFQTEFTSLARTEAHIHITHLALALRLYRLEHGTYPDTLEALVPDYLPSLPPDPFAQEPFRYRREGKGFVVYSVGENPGSQCGMAEGLAGSWCTVWEKIARTMEGFTNAEKRKTTSPGGASVRPTWFRSPPRSPSTPGRT